MHQFFKKLGLYFVLIGYFTSAGLYSAAAAPMHDACKAELSKYCDTVTPGDGRLMACLYAHEDKISNGCDEATDDISSILDTVLAKIEEVQSQCAADLEKLCGGVKYGEGRILTCLKDNSSSLTAECKKAMPPIADGLGQ